MCLTLGSQVVLGRLGRALATNLGTFVAVIFLQESFVLLEVPRVINRYKSRHST